MSLDTWKREFYPSPASDFRAGWRATPPTAVEAAEHSLKKWEGMLSHNLARHGVSHPFLGELVEIDNPYKRIAIAGEVGCALCHYYNLSCGRCPLRAVTPTACGSTSNYGEVCRSFSSYGEGEETDAAIRKLLADLKSATAKAMDTQGGQNVS